MNKSLNFVSVLVNVTAEKGTNVLVEEETAICHVQAIPAKSVAAHMQTVYILVSGKNIYIYTKF